MKIQEWYDQELSHLEEVQKNLSEDYWIPCLEVDGARQPHIVRYIMQKKLRPLTENRLSLFERCAIENTQSYTIHCGFYSENKIVKSC